MTDTFLNGRFFHHLSCVELALMKQNQATELRGLRNTIVILRLEARKAVESVQKTKEAVRTAERAMKKGKKSGIVFPAGEKRVDYLSSEYKSARKELAQVGTTLSTVLDLWQQRGATLQDLCNLCNRNYAQVMEEIKSDSKEESFSALIFVYNLDYKDPRNRGWIEDDVDAPLTHAIKEYMIDQICHTENGQKAAHEALVTCFPEIWDNRLISYTDAEGVQRFMDKDGVEVETLEIERGTV